MRLKVIIELNKIILSEISRDLIKKANN